MDPEHRDLHRGTREERRRMLSNLDPDPHDVAGYGRPGGIDDPVPDVEHDDDHSEPAAGYPEEGGEERVTLPIPNGTEYDVDDLEDGTIVVQWWCPADESPGATEGNQDD